MYKTGTKKQGFTLAEVLVTLAIIGVIAALTIPTLIKSTNAAKFTTGVKKAVSTLNSCIQTQIANNNIDASSTTGADDATASINLATFMKASLNVLKDNADGNIWLADGSHVQFHGLAAGCADIANPSDFTPGCYAIVDVNGDKGPNTIATATTTGDVYIIGIGKTVAVPVAPHAAVTVTLKDIGNATLVNAATIAAANNEAIAAITTK